LEDGGEWITDIEQKIPSGRVNLHNEPPLIRLSFLPDLSMENPTMVYLISTKYRHNIVVKSKLTGTTKLKPFANLENGQFS
jgi:hypothetical protein